MQTETQVETQVVTLIVSPEISKPTDFGRWMGAMNAAAQAAFWYDSTADIIDYLLGYLETAPAGDYRKAAQMLFDQLTLPQDDCASYEEWRYGF